MQRIPNLFLIGAKKSATSSLWEYIRTHPQIYSSDFKEPRFFYDNLGCKDLEEYLELFRAAGDQRYLLDASPQYTLDGGSARCARRIFEFNPQARIIYLLRDPFDRMVSDYLFSVWRHRETRDIITTLSIESTYLRSSFYAVQLKPYWEIFGEAAIYIDTFEKLVADPAAFCRRLFKWLSIDQDFVPANLDKHLMRTPAKLPLLCEEDPLVRLWRIIRGFPNFTALFPRRFRRWSRKLLKTRELVDSDSVEFAAAKEELRRMWAEPIYDSIAELEKLTNREFVEWPSRAPQVPTACALPLELQGAS